MLPVVCCLVRKLNTPPTWTCPRLTVNSSGRILPAGRSRIFFKRFETSRSIEVPSSQFLSHENKQALARLEYTAIYSQPSNYHYLRRRHCLLYHYQHYYHLYYRQRTKTTRGKIIVSCHLQSSIMTLSSKSTSSSSSPSSSSSIP